MGYQSNYRFIYLHVHDVHVLTYAERFLYSLSHIFHMESKDCLTLPTSHKKGLLTHQGKCNAHVCEHRHGRSLAPELWL